MPSDVPIRAALGVEKLEGRSLPSTSLPTAIHAAGEIPATAAAQVVKMVDGGSVFFPVAHNYQVTTGFFGR